MALRRRQGLDNPIASGQLGVVVSCEQDELKFTHIPRISISKLSNMLA